MCPIFGCWLRHEILNVCIWVVEWQLGCITPNCIFAASPVSLKSGETTTVGIQVESLCNSIIIETIRKREVFPFSFVNRLKWKRFEKTTEFQDYPIKNESINNKNRRRKINTSSKHEEKLNDVNNKFIILTVTRI